MNRADLALRLAQRYPWMRAADARAVVDTVLGSIAASLAAGQRVELRGFGTFTRRQRAPRTDRNPRNGAAVLTPAKMAPHFKPSRQLLERLPPPTGPDTGT